MQRPTTELIDSFYETNKKWLIGPIIMDFNYILNPALLEFYTYPQPVHGGIYSVEFYGKERYITRTMTDIEININRNIENLKITLTDDRQTIFTMLMNRKNDIYPEVKIINIHSQMTIIPIENDQESR